MTYIRGYGGFPKLVREWEEENNITVNQGYQHDVMSTREEIIDYITRKIVDRKVIIDFLDKLSERQYIQTSSPRKGKTVMDMPEHCRAYALSKGNDEIKKALQKLATWLKASERRITTGHVEKETGSLILVDELNEKTFSISDFGNICCYTDNGDGDDEHQINCCQDVKSYYGIRNKPLSRGGLVRP